MSGCQTQAPSPNLFAGMSGARTDAILDQTKACCHDNLWLLFGRQCSEYLSIKNLSAQNISESFRENISQEWKGVIAGVIAKYSAGLWGRQPRRNQWRLEVAMGFLSPQGIGMESLSEGEPSFLRANQSDVKSYPGLHPSKEVWGIPWPTPQLPLPFSVSYGSI